MARPLRVPMAIKLAGGGDKALMAWPLVAISFPNSKWLVTQKLNFFKGLPPSVQNFFVIWHVPLNARVSGYLNFKFHNQKYAKREKLWSFKSK